MKIKILLMLCAGIMILLFGIAWGSVYIPPEHILNIIIHKTLGTSLSGGLPPSEAAIVWNLRLPRVLLAFIVGSALSVSGVLMQSVLQNPLASSYTLGVSAGASLGACMVLLLGVTIPLIPMLTLPLVGFLFGLGTILLVITFASYVDGQMQNNTIILTGMVISLFANAVTTLLSALSREYMQRLLFWQMGSFSLKDWSTVFLLLPISMAGILLAAHFHRELDIMTFGEEQAKTMGVNLNRVKWILFLIAAALTGSAIAFVGIIGFVDLVAPHIVRKLFGSSHKYVIPMSAIFGGIFMVICDLLARTVVSPGELPVGAVTAIIGAPFFAYLYLRKR